MGIYFSNKENKELKAKVAELEWRLKVHNCQGSHMPNDHPPAYRKREGASAVNKERIEKTVVHNASNKCYFPTSPFLKDLKARDAGINYNSKVYFYYGVSATENKSAKAVGVLRKFLSGDCFGIEQVELGRLLHKALGFKNSTTTREKADALKAILDDWSRPVRDEFRYTGFQKCAVVSPNESYETLSEYYQDLLESSGQNKTGSKLDPQTEPKSAISWLKNLIVHKYTHHIPDKRLGKHVRDVREHIRQASSKRKYYTLEQVLKVLGTSDQDGYDWQGMIKILRLVSYNDACCRGKRNPTTPEEIGDSLTVSSISYASRILHHKLNANGDGCKSSKVPRNHLEICVFQSFLRQLQSYRKKGQSRYPLWYCLMTEFSSVADACFSAMLVKKPSGGFHSEDCFRHWVSRLDDIIGVVDERYEMILRNSSTI